MDELNVTRRGRVLILEMNRPQARNAVSKTLAHAMAEAFEQLDSDPELSVGVLSGSGGTFSTGMDLKGFARGERPVVPGRGFAGLVERPPEKPLIAAVEGYALAGGFEMVLACDLVVAAENATFGIPEVKRGLCPAAGALLRLHQRIPYNKAMEFALTGRMIPAAEADLWGLISRLVPAGQALRAAVELAEEVTQNAPMALRACKLVMHKSADWLTEESFERQEEIVGPVRASNDAAEGARAFLEKRTPSWTGT